ncbi:MAG: hypothetical protein A2928_02145 [Candidatus Taylorbacteria bacterium RIFCSPLOWO2_01_FULL_45_15b]|uniref:MAM domain-containing protein n=1 Tax=Candidatus Taylorbacteria bacterium RIFCSPLOWO2_01_FULL_45_15b TaxID=1802319 RepID=A0A1G2N6Z9_9BACT|nr:MAG: hypothetical protein A2928_02145 [Candidatus Taylorbacteria bacterium RIFCSPLOWO2_01_FULL_45_15b]
MKKILLSVAVIAFVAAIVAGATGAFFSDTETSTGNTFTAGAIDLTIDNESYVTSTTTGQLIASPETSWELSNLTNQLFFDFEDLKPGDVGEDTISLHVNSNDAWACMAINLTATPENGQTEPELAVPDTTVGTNDGELQNELKFVFWNDDGDNVYEDGESAFWQNQTIAQISTAGTVALADSSGTGVLGTGPIVGNTERYIGKAWCFGDMTLTPVAQDGDGKTGTNGPLVRGTGISCSGVSATNITQTDGIRADVSFTAEQSRNNGSFLCNPPVQPVPTTMTLLGSDFSGTYASYFDLPWQRSYPETPDTANLSDDVQLTSLFATSTGDVHVRLDDDAAITATIDTTGKTNITLRYDRRTESVAAGDFLRVEYSTDGGTTWTNLENVNSSTWTTQTWTLASAAENIPNLMVRFFMDNGGGDNAHIDNIVVTGFGI